MTDDSAESQLDRVELLDSLPSFDLPFSSTSALQKLEERDREGSATMVGRPVALVTVEKVMFVTRGLLA